MRQNYLFDHNWRFVATDVGFNLYASRDLSDLEGVSSLSNAHLDVNLDLIVNLDGMSRGFHRFTSSLSLIDRDMRVLPKR